LVPVEGNLYPFFRIIKASKSFSSIKSNNGCKADAFQFKSAKVEVSYSSEIYRWKVECFRSWVFFNKFTAS
jgi:hypothetical protein